MTGLGTAFAVYRGCLIDRGKDSWSVHRPEICLLPDLVTFQLACCYPLVRPMFSVVAASPRCRLLDFEGLVADLGCDNWGGNN